MNNLNDNDNKSLVKSENYLTFYRSLSAIQAAAVKYVSRGHDLDDVQTRMKKVADGIHPIIAMLRVDDECEEGYHLVNGVCVPD